MPAGPNIQKLPPLNLSPEIETVLQAMFAEFGRVVIERELGHGLSPARVFQVRLVESGGTFRLPTVVKIAPAYLVEQERRAYQHWVAGKLPGVVRLEAAPALPNSSWAGLNYTLAGEGAFEVQSLSNYCGQASAEDLWWVLAERLYQLIGLHWWLDHRLERAFHVQADYDSVLPVNLILQPLDPPPKAPVHHISAEYLPPASLAPAETVQLTGFLVTEINPEQQQVTLNLSSPGASSLLAYRVRLTGVPAPERYHVGQVLNRLTALVICTRQDLLLAEAARALDATIDLTAAQLATPSDPADWPAHSFTKTLSAPLFLPNPLLAYQQFLNDFIPVNISTIHGDLNLENILVDPQTRSLNLIDFAAVRQGHSLHDLLRMETEVVTKLVSSAVAEARLPVLIIYALYQWLHQTNLQTEQEDFFEPLSPALEKPVTMLRAIRKMARTCLFNPDDWSEYYRGLSLYMLGALKFKNLDRLPQAPLPKQLAFWAAATLVSLLDAPAALRPRSKSGQQQPRDVKVTLPKALSRPTFSGDIIRVGNISGSGVAIGRGAQVSLRHNIGGDKTIQVFQAVQQQIELKPLAPFVDKEVLLRLVAQIQAEVVRGEQANLDKVRQCLAHLIEMAPDTSRTIVEGLAQPLPGVAPAIRQLALSAGEEMDQDG